MSHIKKFYAINSEKNIKLLIGKSVSNWAFQLATTDTIKSLTDWYGFINDSQLTIVDNVDKTYTLSEFNNIVLNRYNNLNYKDIEALALENNALIKKNKLFFPKLNQYIIKHEDTYVLCKSKWVF